MAANELARLLLRIEADTSRLRRELKVVEGQTRTTGRRMERAFGRASRGLDAMTRKMVSARGAAVALAGASALGLAVRRAIDFADEIAKTADRIGIATDALQELRFAADLAGVSQANLDSALEAFSKRLGEARAGTGTLTTFLGKLDEELLAQVTSAGSVDEAFDLIMRAMAGLENQADRTALSAAAFGRTAGIEMANLVRGGFEELDAARKKARDLGIVLDESLLRSSEKAKDQLTILATVIKANFTRGLISGFTDEFETFAEALADPAFAEGVRAIGEDIGGTLRFIAAHAREIASVLAGLVALRFAPGGPLVKLLAAVAAGGATYIALGDSILTADEAMARLAEDMAELERINAQIAAEGGIDVARPGLLENRRRVMAEILDLEMKLAKESGKHASMPSARSRKTPVVEIGPSKEDAAKARRIFEETRTAAERFAARIEELNRLRANGALTQATFQRAVEKASREAIAAQEAEIEATLRSVDAFDGLSDAGRQAFDDLKQAVEGFGREFSRTMAEALVTGDFTFKSLGRSFLANFAEKVIQQRITDPLFSVFSGFLDNLSFGDLFGGGGGASSTALSLSGPRFMFATGGVIDHGAVQAFARGGVVNRPTLFRLASGAGLMGEAGPEAILPLARTPSGDLGVKAAGGGSAVNVTIVNNTAEPVQTRTFRRGNQGRDLEVVIGRLVSRDIRSGGETFKAVRETFNLAPATALR